MNRMFHTKCQACLLSYHTITQRYHITGFAHCASKRNTSPTFLASKLITQRYNIILYTIQCVSQLTITQRYHTTGFHSVHQNELPCLPTFPAHNHKEISNYWITHSVLPNEMPSLLTFPDHNHRDITILDSTQCLVYLPSQLTIIEISKYWIPEGVLQTLMLSHSTFPATIT